MKSQKAVMDVIGQATGTECYHRFSSEEKRATMVVLFYIV